MMTFVDMCGLAVDGHCLCFNSCNQLFCDWMVVYKEQNEEGMTFRKYLCNTYITIISLYLFRINQQTAWRLRHGPPSPPKKKTMRHLSSLKRWIWWSQVDSRHAEGILQVSISCGHLGSHQIPGWFSTMNFSDWMIGFQSYSTVWALKGSSVVRRGKLRIWFALSPWRYLHGRWLHCPQRPDAGDSTFGRSWFDFLRYPKQPRSCHLGKRWNGEILRLSWISLIGSSPYIKSFQGAGTSSS